MSTQEELNSKTCMALGQFVVAFSGVLHALETSTMYLIAPAPDGARWALLGAALADRTAAPIVASFFSVFHKRWEGSLSPEDSKILHCLRRELDDLVKQRNRLMHDAWMNRVVGGDPSPQPMSRHRVRAHGKGVEYENESYPPEKLEQIVQDANRLASVIHGAVWYRRDGQQGPELHSRMQIVDGKVQRNT